MRSAESYGDPVMAREAQRWLTDVSADLYDLGHEPEAQALAQDCAAYLGIPEPALPDWLRLLAVTVARELASES